MMDFDEMAKGCPWRYDRPASMCVRVSDMGKSDCRVTMAECHERSCAPLYWMRVAQTDNSGDGGNEMSGMWK